MDVKKLPQVKALLRQFDLKAKKKLGQHFLINEDVLDHILSAAELSSEDIVVEVGPGLGILTEKLVEQVAKVIAVELDPNLASMLNKRLASFSNIKIIQGDILEIAPQQLLEDNLAAFELGKGYKVVANLPYYVTSPILRHFLEALLKPSLMVVMVQKEVGEVIAAAPGKMSLLTAATQFYSEPTIIAYVPAKSFYPPPKVDSVILRLDVYPKPPIEISDVASFFDLVSNGFKLPRKQLRNSLAQSLGILPEQVSLLLENAEIEATRRAETLSLEEWKKLWEAFAPFRK